MVYEPRVRLLASQLRACLANAQVERSRDPA
jgi:hypothetical protein